ncbi:dCMP deaminase [Halobacillus karajensis]|uniref:ComE operon protein 2 n=1 Tax=Halobacillus karajensis TaxID=195088 RepID=A0A024P7S5_9BACI|nr:ComE operon protein 2 [Halobacillus karajensis]CDQ18061.1 deoxycytidylate deaminase [Halobacillus karajensis]CDQ24412.1 deoxycytidylate deaminase [Halobacillus karajensis]CDQ29340.1 deoxycytidylate deaminase [Halobacillus karajensis]SEH60050.1 dCMP deaminase [Halobacillus karajensis]
MERITWNQYFMAQSYLLKSRSTCQRLAVGAVIVRDKRMIAGGYNGSVSGGVHCIDEGCYVVEGHCVRTIHAEMNALLQCSKFGVATDNAEIYVTHFPCLHCTKAIIQAGIKAVYYSEDYKNNPYAIELLQQSGVRMQKVPIEKETLPTEQQILINKMLDKLESYEDPEALQLKEEAHKKFTLDERC